MVQTDVASSKYEMTFWEKNGGTIKQWGVPIISVLSFIALRGNTGAALKYGSSSGNQMEKDHSKKQEQIIRRYDILRNIIAGLKFGI